MQNNLKIPLTSEFEGNLLQALIDINNRCGKFDQSISVMYSEEGKGYVFFAHDIKDPILYGTYLSTDGMKKVELMLDLHRDDGTYDEDCAMNLYNLLLQEATKDAIQPKD